MSSCYLTIDDSPSRHTDALTDHLFGHNIPALLFVRGDLTAANPQPIINAIQKGFVIGNHSFSHRPFGDLSYEEAVADIEKCDDIINECYHAAGVARHGQYFRFPYLDRGNGDRIERHFETVSDVDINTDENVARLQSYLKTAGYIQPFKTNHPLYSNPSIEGSADCLMTYTSYDWMLTDRHRGQWDYKTIEDLKTRIDDSNMRDCEGNILIFHDQDETFEIFKILIDHMLLKGYEFLGYDNNK